MTSLKLNSGSELSRVGVDMRWGVKIPMRDGVHLSATLYLPEGHDIPSPVVFTLTPYTAQSYHSRGMYFAAHGYPFLAVDVRGRGNSEGIFQPKTHDANDGHDVVEWLARQSYCNGQVAMWGGSYGGHIQWTTASQLPPHLTTIVPVASSYPGVDVPMRCNIPNAYRMQWLMLVSGRTAQDYVSSDMAFWGEKYRRWFESGMAFKELDTFVGNPSDIFQESVAHPQQGAYWDRQNPRAEQYARISIPVLTITGIYDGDQPGALQHYREHLNNASSEARGRHHLVIGPWDHHGTRTPVAEFLGIKVGSASLVDLPKLHLEWYAWIMQRGPRPEFLKKRVAYYVMVADQWRYADTLEEVTARAVPLYLHSTSNPTDVFKSGSLTAESEPESAPDQYIYDPRDVSHAALEASISFGNLADQRLVHTGVGKRLIYHTAPFDADTEVSGFFKLSAWLSIDQPDTDFRVWIYDIGVDGGSVLLTYDSIRARYRESLREEKLIGTQDPLRYDFERFPFVSRRILRGNRLRLVIGPVNSIYVQKNFNSGGVVSEESMPDARAVLVKLFHDASHPSALYVPFGRPEDPPPSLPNECQTTHQG